MGLLNKEIVNVSSKGTSLLGFIADVFVLFTLISMCLKLSGFVPPTYQYLLGFPIVGTLFILVPWRNKSIQYILKIGLSIIGLFISNVIK